MLTPEREKVIREWLQVDKEGNYDPYNSVSGPIEVEELLAEIDRLRADLDFETEWVKDNFAIIRDLRQKLDVAIKAFDSFVSTTHDINEHIGYKFSQPLIEASIALSKIRGENADA